jgi:hypothetical protein
MKFIQKRLGCLFHGHQWYRTSSPFGAYTLCRHCQSTR